MVLVWDIFVRITHWAVALGFFVSYLTEDELLTLHVWAGYLVGGLVVLRILWGFVGPRHARFSDIVTGPRAIVGYLLALFSGRAQRYLGHSPAGGAMAIVLWLGLLGTVWSGLEFYAAEEGLGPLAATSLRIEAAAGLAVVSPAQASEDEYEAGERGSGPWKEIHEILANITMFLVVLHILGVVLSSFVHRENLVRAMVDGRKRAE